MPALGFTVGVLRAARGCGSMPLDATSNCSALACCAPRAAGCRSIGSAAPIYGGLPGEVAGGDRSASCAACGTISAASAPSTPISTACGTTTREQRPGRIDRTDDTRAVRAQLRDDGKPALIFAAHLANWELPAVAGRQLRPRHHGALSPARTSATVADAIDAHPRRQHGPADPPGSTRRCRLRRRARSAAAMSACWSTSITRAGVAGDVLRPHDCKANPLIARLARHVECPIHGVRVVRLPGRPLPGAS